MPLHQGHCYLIDYAATHVERLIIVVGTLESEPIDGYLRYQWVRETYPQHTVIHLTENLPQSPEEHPDFWQLWEKALNIILDSPPDIVFASEHYGEKLAKVLKATFCPCDIKREKIPISATLIRKDPHKYWAYIPKSVRPYFTIKICIYGPESCGKTTLAKDLGQYFGAEWVPEYARKYLEQRHGQLTVDDMLLIAEGQWALEKKIMKQGHKMMIADTDPLLTCVWSEFMYDKVDARIVNLATQNNYHCYLLLHPDVPWIEDKVRYTPLQREPFYDLAKQYLATYGRNYVEISGSWEERLQLAKLAVKGISTIK